MSATPDSTSTKPEQRIADLERRLAEREAELAEAREQQTATAEVLQLINSSPGNLAPVFDAILERALTLCEAAIGTLGTFDGQLFHWVASQGAASVYAQAIGGSTLPTPGLPLEQIVNGEDIVHVRDVAEIAEALSVSPGWRDFADTVHPRTSLWIGLRKDSVLQGAVVIWRQEVRPFTDKQIALLQNFGSQAVIAMENARLITETREVLDQETATAEVLQVINSSPGDLVPVFDGILEKARAVCGFEQGSLTVFDGEYFRTIAMHGIPETFAEVLRQPRRAGPQTLFLSGERIVHIPDFAAEAPAVGDNRVYRAAVAAGIRTVLFVPLRTEQRLLGYITVNRREVRPFSDKQIRLLENFAALAVIAMENARLLTESREALEQQTATAEVLGVINSSPGDLAAVFDTILEKAHNLCGVARGSLELYDGEKFWAVATHGLDQDFADQLRQGYPASRNPATRPLIEGQPFTHIPDISAHEFPFTRNPADATKARTLLCVALRHDDRLLGMIAVARDEMQPFTDKQIALLQNFAAQAVIAMENARLLTETREALERQTAMAESLGVINSSLGNLTPVFDAILEKAHSLCEISFICLLTYDGERFHTAAQNGLPIQFREVVGNVFQAGPDNPLSRLVHGERLVHMGDAVENSGWGNCVGYSHLFDAGSIRTMVLVSLRKHGALLGAIAAFRQEVRPFTDKQIALLQNFAAQAVIAMENARLLTETREALEQQTATAEVLSVINSSPGHLAPVFDTILEKAHALCGADRGALMTFDGSVFRAAATRGVPAAFDQLLRRGLPLVAGSPVEPLLRGEHVHIDDFPAFVAAQPPEVARVASQVNEIAGTRSLLMVPLRKDNSLLGYIAAYRTEVRPFTGKQIALLQNFAAQAVIAMENARLLTETREALEQQTATAEVLQVINASPGDLAPVFDAMLDKAMRLCEANFGFLSTYDGQRFTAVALHGLPDAYIEEYLTGPYLPGPNTTHDRLVRGELVVHVPNLAVDSADSLRRRAVVEVLGVRSILAVPLYKDGALLGAIHVYRQEVRSFTDKQIALLQSFAAQAVIAMENARLLGELRQRTDEVAELNRGLEARVAEQVEELGRVGRLKRFLAPQLAELIVSHGEEKILESHRREIVVVFCDLRGYTAFTETAEPEEVLEFLRQYHGALGPLVSQFEGTLDQFSGDGIMVFFNDPVPCPDPAERAVKMAMAMREAAGKLIAAWRRHGSELGFGVGIAQGYATLGQIGFTDRSGYTAIGTVCNLASRLCAGAKDGQILVSSRIAEAVEAVVKLEDLGELELRGLRRPVAAFNVQSTSAPGAHPKLTAGANESGA